MSGVQPRHGPRSAIPATDLRQGMISPATPFVDEQGVLAPVSFRFLFTLWNGLSGNITAFVSRGTAEDQRIAELEARVAALEVRSP